MLQAIRWRQVIDKAWQSQGREVDAKHGYQQRQFTSSSSSLLQPVHIFKQFASSAVIALGSGNRLKAGKSPNQLGVDKQPAVNHRR
jgi:hypothetical protein